jgi:glycosyltransferase involved in cell wall biosynthesis
MRILIDLSMYNSTQTGVFNYAYRILKGFQENKYPNIILLCNKYIAHEIKSEFKNYPCIIFDTSITSQNVIWKSFLWSKKINSIPCDVVFIPQITLYNFFCNKPIVHTIHDLQALRTFSLKYRIIYYISFGILIFQSKSIITISNYVKEQIKKLYPFINKSKLKTIYNCVQIQVPITAPNYDNYLLYVSSITKSKNLLTLIKAFNLIKNNINENLIIIGKSIPPNYFPNYIQPYILKHKLSDRIIIITHGITDEELSNYYQNARLFIHPSLMEGFGYTPIEAAIHKIPVITTKETCIYETTKGLLNYYSPSKDENALAQKIIELLQNYPNKDTLNRISDILQKEYNYISQSEKVYQHITSLFK